ncbi:hypothetical protein HID58_090672, partial [Brassica napus]
NEIDRIKKENDNLQLELRHLKGEDIQSLNLKNLMAVEHAIEHGLDKMEYLMTKRRNLHQTFSVAGKNVGGGESATQFP